jgi:nicotinamide-nucleotide amidase
MASSRNLTLATAESLTGGWVSAALTSVPGSSAYFLAGLVTYSNEAKIKLLGVPAEIIARHGAVSPECARFMARGARQAGEAAFGLATTGIAGPDGGTADKPVGLVYVAAANARSGWVKRLDLSGDRLDITISASTLALAFLLEAMASDGLGETGLA